MENRKEMIGAVLIGCLIPLWSNAFLFENRSQETVYVVTFQSVPQIAHFLFTHGWDAQDLTRIEPPQLIGAPDQSLFEQNRQFATLAQVTAQTKPRPLQSTVWRLNPGKCAIWNWKKIQKYLNLHNCTHLFFALFACSQKNIDYKSLIFLSALDIKAKLTYLGNSTLKENFFEEHTITFKPVTATTHAMWTAP